ncbi:MAG: peroxidase [Rugosibacter sp.]|nr:MAG: peroxidase [Rugosibacter sp.]
MSRFSSLPSHATVMDVFKLSPELTNPILDYHEVLLRGPSPLSIAERELIAAYVSGVNNCGFCHGAHTATAEACGIGKGLVKEFLADINHPELSEKMRPILSYVRKLTEVPSSITVEDVAAVFNAGWNEQALHHAIHVCALFNFMNRLVEGHGIEALSPVISEQLGRQLRDQGYAQFKAP